MPPEIALGHGDVDGRADIYSLGCLAYYLLTGHAVFSGDTSVAVALAHVQEQPVPPSVRSEFQIPAALEALILECLAKDPGARPASAVVVGNRLAETVLHDTWTQEDAHLWWELHRSGSANGGGACSGRGRVRSGSEGAGRDCTADVTNARGAVRPSRITS